MELKLLLSYELVDTRLSSFTQRRVVNVFNELSEEQKEVVYYLIGRAMEERVMGEWISFKKQMPPMGVDILLTDGKIVETGHLFIDDDEDLMIWVRNCGSLSIPCYTHWMALPELPKEA